MGVTTIADKKLRNAKEKLDGAYKDLLEFLDEDNWGHSEYPSDFIDTVHEAALDLLKIKRKL